MTPMVAVAISQLNRWDQKKSGFSKKPEEAIELQTTKTTFDPKIQCRRMSDLGSKTNHC